MRILVDFTRIQLGKFEFVLIVLLFCVVALTLVRKAEKVAADAEQLSMELTVKSLRYSVTAEALLLTVREGSLGPVSLVGTNPMALVEAPHNYQGEFAGEPRETPAGSWHFDQSRGEIVYRTSHPRRFRSAGSDPEEARFRIALPPSAALPELEVVAPYAWER